MLCPLKFNSTTTDKDGNILEDTCQCEKEKCAWWNNQNEVCGIKLLVFVLTQGCKFLEIDK